jgi:hypothetical protein
MAGGILKNDDAQAVVKLRFETAWRYRTRPARAVRSESFLMSWSICGFNVLPFLQEQHPAVPIVCIEIRADRVADLLRGYASSSSSSVFTSLGSPS